MSFLRTSFSVLATQMVVTPIALLTGVVLARGLSVADRGLYASATELAGILVVAIELGWAATTIYRMRRLEIAPARVVGAALWVTIAVSTAAIGICLLFEDAILQRFLLGADPRLLRLALLSIPFNLAGLVFTGVARGLGLFGLHNLHRLAAAGLLLAGVTLAVWLQGDATTAIAAMLVAHAVASTVVVGLVVRTAGIELAPPVTEVRQSLRFGFLSHLQQILNTLHQRLDLLLLAWISSDPEAVAIYAVAVGVINRVRILPMSMALALFPTLAGQGDEDAARFSAKVTRFSIVLVVGTALPLGLAAPWIVPLLFGSAYTSSVTPLLLLLPASIFLTPALLMSRYFTARARQPTAIAILGLATVLNIVLNLIWIPRFGVLGAAGASSVSYGVQFALMLVAFSRETGRPIRESMLVSLTELRAYWPRLISWWRARAG